MNENPTPATTPATTLSKPAWRSKKWRVLLVAVACLIGLKLLSTYLETPTPKARRGLEGMVLRFEGEFPYQDAEVRFYTRFVSGNPLCSPTSFLGVLIGRALISSEIGLDPAYAVAPVEVKRGEGNRFSGQMYIDHFNSGWCGWRWDEELLFDVRPHAATDVPPLAEWPMPGIHTARTRLRVGEKVRVKCSYTKSQVFGCSARHHGPTGEYSGKTASLEFEVYPRIDGKAK